MNEIEIRLGEHCWLAIYHGPHAARVVSAFGTDTLPTAWLPRTIKAHVITAVSILNPGVNVS